MSAGAIGSGSRLDRGRCSARYHASVRPWLTRAAVFEVFLPVQFVGLAHRTAGPGCQGGHAPSFVLPPGRSTLTLDHRLTPSQTSPGPGTLVEPGVGTPQQAEAPGAASVGWAVLPGVTPAGSLQPPPRAIQSRRMTSFARPRRWRPARPDRGNPCGHACGLSEPMTGQSISQQPCEEGTPEAKPFRICLGHGPVRARGR